MRISDYLFPREGERQYTVGTHTYRNTQSKSKYAQHTKHTPTVPHNSKSQASPNNHLHNQSIADENVYCASQFTIDGHSALRNSTHLNTHTHTRTDSLHGRRHLCRLPLEQGSWCCNSSRGYSTSTTSLSKRTAVMQTINWKQVVVNWRKVITAVITFERA